MQKRTATRPRWLEDWLERHRSPVSFWLHMVGIPLAVAALPLAVFQVYAGLWAEWWRPIALLALGYTLQFIGHWYEGNDVGEVILIKKWLGLPYVAVSPRYRDRSGPADEPAEREGCASASAPDCMDGRNPRAPQHSDEAVDRAARSAAGSD